MKISLLLSLMCPVNSQVQSFYGGRMTNDRLLAVRNATSETIDHLHDSLESCPGPEAEAPDPKGIKVSLPAHLSPRVSHTFLTFLI